MDEATFLTILHRTVENHGCTVVELDIDNRNISVDGPDHAIEACARALAELAAGP